jgi:hypothetical protein
LTFEECERAVEALGHTVAANKRFQGTFNGNVPRGCNWKFTQNHILFNTCTTKNCGRGNSVQHPVCRKASAPSPAPGPISGPAVEFHSDDQLMHVTLNHHHYDSNTRSSLDFTVTIEQDSGWFALGISKTGKMVDSGNMGGSDVFVCASGVGAATRYWITGKDPISWESEGKQLVTTAEVSCEFSSGKGVLKFRRAVGVDAGSEMIQREIKLGEQTHFIWAHGNTPNLKFHNRMGSVSRIVPERANDGGNGGDASPSPSSNGGTDNYPSPSGNYGGDASPSPSSNDGTDDSPSPSGNSASDKPTVVDIVLKQSLTFTGITAEQLHGNEKAIAKAIQAALGITDPSITVVITGIRDVSSKRRRGRRRRFLQNAGVQIDFEVRIEVHVRTTANDPAGSNDAAVEAAAAIGAKIKEKMQTLGSSDDAASESIVEVVASEAGVRANEIKLVADMPVLEVKQSSDATATDNVEKKLPVWVYAIGAGTGVLCVTAFALLAARWQGRRKRTFSRLGGKGNKKDQMTDPEKPAVAMVSLAVETEFEETNELGRRKLSLGSMMYQSIGTPSSSGSIVSSRAGSRNRLKSGTHGNVQSQKEIGPAPSVPRRPSKESEPVAAINVGIDDPMKGNDMMFDHRVAAPPPARSTTRHRVPNRPNKRLISPVPASPRTSGRNMPRSGGSILNLPLFGPGRIVRTRASDGCQVVELPYAVLYRFPATQETDRF